MPEYYKTDCIETPKEYEILDLGLSKDQKDQAFQLHNKAIFVNTLTGCSGWPSPHKQFGIRRANNFIEKSQEGGSEDQASKKRTASFIKIFNVLFVFIVLYKFDYRRSINL